MLLLFTCSIIFKKHYRSWNAFLLLIKMERHMLLFTSWTLNSSYQNDTLVVPGNAERQLKWSSLLTHRYPNILSCNTHCQWCVAVNPVQFPGGTQCGIYCYRSWSSKALKHMVRALPVWVISLTSMGLLAWFKVNLVEVLYWIGAMAVCTMWATYLEIKFRDK